MTPFVVEVDTSILLAEEGAPYARHDHNERTIVKRTIINITLVSVNIIRFVNWFIGQLIDLLGK